MEGEGGDLMLESNNRLERELTFLIAVHLHC